jgi:hypothetical protein
MYHNWRLGLMTLGIVLLAADGPTWKEKKIPEWNDDDAKQVLTDSPWVKSVTPTIERSSNNGQGRDGGGMGRGGSGGLRLPGMGGMGGGRGGMGGGYPGGGYPGGGGGYPGGGGGYPGGGSGGSYPGRRQPGSGDDQSTQLPSLHLRWESALPVREAELKTRDINAPTIDENHYAIAVYGVPSRMTQGDSGKLADQLKKQASLKRDGQKDLKPTSVNVLEREDGPVIVYLFPRTKEITAKDGRVEFDAQVGKLKFTQSFFVEDMVFQGKLEL